ncbi:MAG: energy-coupled thiamine transporter ThiT [Oscillospiraceae bacterium]
MSNSKKTRVLVECALMIALSTVLSKLEIPIWIHGGSITAVSMLPILLISYRHGAKWGVGTAFAHSLLQMAMGFQNVLYCKTLSSQIICILLDYIVAFTVLGLAAMFGRPLKNRTGQIAMGSSVAIAIRFVCSFISGIVLWGEYAPAGTPVWVYSLLYNGGYMLPELILTVCAALLLYRAAPKVFEN